MPGYQPVLLGRMRGAVVISYDLVTYLKSGGECNGRLHPFVPFDPPPKNALGSTAGTAAQLFMPTKYSGRNALPSWL